MSTIANQAFCGCTNLNLIRFKRQTPPTFANVYCFTQVPSNALIVVPCNSTSAYSSAMSVWFSNFSEEYAFEITVGTADSTKGTAAVTVVPSCTSNQAQVLATPVQGYQFSHWSDGNTANPRTLAVTQDTLLVAYFPDDADASFCLSVDHACSRLLGNDGVFSVIVPDSEVLF